MEKENTVNKELEEMRDLNVAVIGVGNFGSALAEGIVNSGVKTPLNVILSNRSREKLETFAQRGYTIASSNNEAANLSKTIILAVKPYQILDVLGEIKGVLRDNDFIISVAAGLRINRIKGIVGNCKVVRAMPNLGCKFKVGVTGWFTGDSLSQKEVSIVESLFGSMGVVVKTKSEDGIDRITAMAGSGIGFEFYLQEQLEKIGMQLLNDEVDADTSRKIMVQVLRGTVLMLEKDGRSVSELRKAVTSKGGTTEKGLRFFEWSDLEGILREGIRQAYKRSKELGESL